MSIITIGTRDKKEEKIDQNLIWKNAIDQIIDSSSDMTEEESAAFAERIRAKLKAGENLSPKELDYLRVHEPQLYRSAVRVKNMKENLKTKLENCKSKTEANNVISNAIGTIGDKDPDREYLIAGLSKTAKDFRQSSVYARLPETEDDTKKKSKIHGLVQNDEVTDNDDSNDISNCPIIEILEELPKFEVKA